MPDPYYQDIENVILPPLSEEQAAQRAMVSGKKVVRKSGRYWIARAPGFYEPLHWLACMTVGQAKRPTVICWGYRCSLRQQDVSHANGYMPIHLLDRLEDYDLATLPSKRRNQLRKARKTTAIVQLLHPEPLIQQGYAILRSANLRTGYGKVPTAETYVHNIQRQFANGHNITLAALIGEEIGGYMVVSAVADTMYIDTVLLATEHLSTNLGTALAYEVAQVARRSAGVNKVVYGLHSREAEQLSKFKEGMGFGVHKWPVRYDINPLALSVLRKNCPDKLYRLTGLSC
jgi:hypothetical protein